jgi:hypothetical protein
MKQISIWAKQHVWPARIIVTVSHILLTIIAIYWGVIGFKAGIYLNEGLLYAFILLYLLLFLFYPSANSLALFKNTYTVRVSFHTLMALCSFMLVLSYVNVKMQPATGQSIFAATYTYPKNESGYKNPEAERLMKMFKNGEIKKFTRAERKILREELKYQFNRLKQVNATGEKSDGGNIVIIIVTIVAALALLYGTVALSCSLSCNGNDGAAILVIVLGVAVVIFGAIMVGRALRKKNKADKKPKTDQPS